MRTVRILPLKIWKGAEHKFFNENNNKSLQIKVKTI